MTKLELRKHYLEKRQLLIEAEVSLLNNIIIENLQHLDFSETKHIHLFLPIKKHNEINLWPFIEWIWNTHKQIKIVVPKSNFKTRTMTSIILTPESVLSYDNYSIPEPVSGDIIPNELIDIVITPLIVCDKKGYRVGYGKGFYDNFFKSCTSSVKRIGVGYHEPIENIQDIDKWDIPLTQYISQAGVYNF